MALITVTTVGSMPIAKLRKRRACLADPRKNGVGEEGVEQVLQAEPKVVAVLQQAAAPKGCEHGTRGGSHLGCATWSRRRRHCCCRPRCGRAASSKVHCQVHVTGWILSKGWATPTQRLVSDRSHGDELSNAVVRSNQAFGDTKDKKGPKGSPPRHVADCSLARR